jgi:hypothetical protein
MRSKNILTAMAENESVVKNQNEVERKAIALAWLFHLVGTYTSRYRPPNYLLLSIPTVIEAVTKSVSG